jgi:hypothetical protein
MPRNENETPASNHFDAFLSIVALPEETPGCRRLASLLRLRRPYRSKNQKLISGPSRAMNGAALGKLRRACRAHHEAVLTKFARFARIACCRRMRTLRARPELLMIAHVAHYKDNQRTVRPECSTALDVEANSPRALSQQLSLSLMRCTAHRTCLAKGNPRRWLITPTSATQHTPAPS